MTKEVVILSASRTAIGNFGGSLSTMSATELGARSIRAVLQHLPPEVLVDEVIMGHVIQAGQGQNPARQAAIRAGLDVSIPSLTVNKVCGSGMKSLHFATQSIALGDAEVMVVGGQESMSQAPHVLANSRKGQQLGHWDLRDTLLQDGLTCPLSNDIHMGITAENLAEKYKISRQEQDVFAFNSQLKASDAKKRGEFEDEIFPLVIPHSKGDNKVFSEDEFIRHGTTLEAIAKLKPIFKKQGTVTAANSSGINDGAAAMLVMSAEKAAELNLKPWVRVVGYASSGVEPTLMGLGPIEAARRCLRKAGWNSQDLQVVESNEAFAAQAIAVNQEMDWDTSKVNVKGGAIALGHPIGASGARILVTLIHTMRQRQLKKGLATMCIGGGQGIATALELV